MQYRLNYRMQFIPKRDKKEKTLKNQGFLYEQKIIQKYKIKKDRKNTGTMWASSPAKHGYFDLNPLRNMGRSDCE